MFKFVKIKLEEELRLEKNVWVSMTLLALGLEDKVGEQDDKLESLRFHFAKLRWGTSCLELRS